MNVSNARADKSQGYFSGSYKQNDCIFLMKCLGYASNYRFETVADKEHLIQSGARHYSEMAAKESAPSAAYLRLFETAIRDYKQLLAQHVVDLADSIAKRRDHQITIVSLARAGTPIGVLLTRQLNRWGKDARHYSVSIIRDRGMDEAAMRFIIEDEQRKPESIVFVDGWTAKGVITRELKKAIDAFNERHQSYQLKNELFVISDIGETADIAATKDDYLIPSGILNAVVSGLVSRSILERGANPRQFHGCIYYDTLQAHDMSRSFANRIDGMAVNLRPRGVESVRDTHRGEDLKVELSCIQTEFNVSDINRIKPGIAESTRVMLRRVPDRLLLRSMSDPDIQHLLMLAKEKSVGVTEKPQMSFRALALIKDVL